MQAKQTLRTINLWCALVLTATFIGCTKPRQTTAVGSGVGGAIGAGLGAIVGNQSGNAGSGLAIGAGAGAAVGALVGNALQAQEERNLNQDEALKRQDRIIQAQRNEINELRSIRGDDSHLPMASSPSTPRYRYKEPTVDPESPEVARQLAKLQRRGPRPAGASDSIQSKSFYSIERPETRVALPKTATTSSSAVLAERLPPDKLPEAKSRSPLARYDVRSELARLETATANKTATSDIPVSAQKAINQKIEAPKSAAPSLKTQASTISESDISAPAKKSDPSERRPSSAPTSALAPSSVSPHSKECKEALAERDLAADAPDNSDKLFHLRRALRLCPESAPLHHELGKVYASMQRLKDAETEFQQALSIDPNFSAAKRELSSLLKDEVQF